MSHNDAESEASFVTAENSKVSSPTTNRQGYMSISEIVNNDTGNTNNNTTQATADDILAAETLKQLRMSSGNQNTKEQPGQSEFISRVSSIPLVNTALSMYDRGKQSSTVVRTLDTGVKSVCGPIANRISVDGLDRFACRQLDRLGYKAQEQSAVDGEMPSTSGIRKRTKAQAEAEYESQNSIVAKPNEGSHDNANKGHGPPPSRWQQLVVGAQHYVQTFSEEGLTRLKYCLDWLTYATASLNQHMNDLQAFLATLKDAAFVAAGIGGQGPQAQESYAMVAQDAQVSQANGGNHSHQSNGHRPSISPNMQHTIRNIEEAAQRIARVRREAANTVKQAIKVLTQYAGSVLPGEARQQVRNLILNLPTRWSSVDAALSRASSMASSPAPTALDADSQFYKSPQTGPTPDVANIELDARRAYNFTNESYHMLDNVRRIFFNLHTNAERWIGSYINTNNQQEQHMTLVEMGTRVREMDTATLPPSDSPNCQGASETTNKRNRTQKSHAD
ncbi:transcriptional regulator opi1 [Mycoemilia scoparia]|uniref:Transcriptional regulator opi1 n=1 Tax=Mycoemilia scoparia TaxID=417184 RepID=A0A9W8DW70_9FUNG|nr:transcriptional regulator opi1 [Mycoemilia scoparia]